VTTRVVVGSLTVALFLLTGAQSRAQSAGQASGQSATPSATPAVTRAVTQTRALSLELISPPTKPGELVYVNALLANPGGARVLVIRETLQFPREKLVFSRAELGIAGSLADAVLTVDMKNKSGVKVKDKEAAEILEVAITAKKTFPDGPLIEFEFRLADAKEQSIPLTHKAEALDDQGKKIAAFSFSNVKVEITKDVDATPSPAIGCFFFTH